MKYVKDTLLILAIAQVLVGCEPKPAPAEKNGGIQSYAALPTHWPLYGIGFYNDTDGVLDNVRLEFEVAGKSYEVPGGYKIPHSTASAGGCPDPIPVEGIVRWKTADGAEHNQRVALTANIKDQRSFDGDIWLKITNTRVLVEPLTSANELERATHGLRQVP